MGHFSVKSLLNLRKEWQCSKLIFLLCCWVSFFVVVFYLLFFVFHSTDWLLGQRDSNVDMFSMFSDNYRFHYTDALVYEAMRYLVIMKFRYSSMTGKSPHRVKYILLDCQYSADVITRSLLSLHMQKAHEWHFNMNIIKKFCVNYKWIKQGHANMRGSQRGMY